MAHKVEGGSPAPAISPRRRRRPVGEPPLCHAISAAPPRLILTLLLLGAIYTGEVRRTDGRSVPTLARPRHHSVFPDLSNGRLDDGQVPAATSGSGS